MKQCPQTKDTNVFQHGLQVWSYYRKLIDGKIEGMKIPLWFSDNKEEILSSIHDRFIIKQYAIFHDIGKTRCIEYDESGRRHFPNHAVISKEMWQEQPNANSISGFLIGLDMIFHIESAEQILLRNLDRRTLYTLMLAALAELHANANMFGGITSESFCIKYKKLSSRAKKILSSVQ